MFYCRILSADEFRGHFLKDMKKQFSCFRIEKIFRKRVDLNETKARTNVQIKYYEKWNKFIVSWLWKACAFDSYTTMVVILLVYIKLFL